MRDILKIKRECDKHFDIDISKKTRVRKYADARKMYYKICRELLSEPVQTIGDIVNVDHSTVIVGAQRLEDLIRYDSITKENYLSLKYKCIDVVKIMNNPFVKYLGKEDLLQNKVMTYLQTKYPDIYVIHVPNEGKRTPFMQFKFKYLGGKRGIPDILIFHQNKKNKCGLAIELKVGYNKPTKNQFEALESLKKANWECHWLNDYEKTIQIINEYFK
jgi:hypothetical protein